MRISKRRGRDIPHVAHVAATRLINSLVAHIRRRSKRSVVGLATYITIAPECWAIYIARALLPHRLGVEEILGDFVSRKMCSCAEVGRPAYRCAM